MLQQPLRIGSDKKKNKIPDTNKILNSVGA